MYYGWYVVGIVFTAQLFVIGVFTYAFSLFVVPIQDTFDASRTEVMQSMTLTTVLMLVVSPLIGTMVDRYSARWLMAVGTIVFGGGLWLSAHSQTLWQFVLIFAVSMGLANLLLGTLVGSATVARWFDGNRGRALGVASTGTSVGGLVVPPLVAYWLIEGDWRLVMEYLSYCVFAILLPLVLVAMRGPPPSRSSETGEGPGDIAAVDQQSLSLRDVITHRAYWLIGLSTGLLFCVYSALLANLTPYAMGLGIDQPSAARLIMIVSISGLVGKLIFGLAADKIDLRLGLWLAQALQAGALLMLSLDPPYSLISLAAVLLGLSAGGMLPVWTAMLAAVFGVVSYGRVMGLMSPLVTLLIMPGYTLAGFLYDLTGAYRLCFLAFVGLLIVAALLLVKLQLPRAQAPSKPSTMTAR
jgi:MFS family permease